MIVTVKCDLCRRAVHYWASDLVQILGAHHLVDKPPWPCGKCRTPDHMSVRCKVWAASQMQDLTVRRPVKQVTRWIWRNERA